MGPSKITWWDRFLIGLAPDWGLKRLKARFAAFAFEAAAGGRRAAGWYRTSSDANAANRPALVALRELSRDLRRNNGWARRGIQVIANNTVGWGITPKAVASNAKVVRAATQLWKDWGESTHCDHDGRLSFCGLQKLVMQTVAEAGECLIVRQPAASAEGLPVPIRLQVLEPDYLSPIQDGVRTNGNGVIIQGVEFDEAGHRVAYWLYTRHPGSALAGLTVRGAPFATIRVPAENVLHVYQVERPGQVRGVPWLASAIARLNDFDDFEDAELMKAKVAACFAAFVQDFEGASTALGEQDVTDTKLESLEPGQITYLPPGKSVTFSQPQGVTDGSFTTRNLRRVAASLGVTYEDLTGDYSQVNFSSARMARLAHWANVTDWRENMLIPQFCAGAWSWVMQMAAGLNGWGQVPTAEWTPPPMPMIEPDKEGSAYQRLVRAGAMTIPQMIRELGYDPDTHLQEIADTNKKLDELGIVLDTDPRQTNLKGAVQPAGQEDLPAGPDGSPPSKAMPMGPNGKPPSGAGNGKVSS